MYQQMDITNGQFFVAFLLYTVILIGGHLLWRRVIRPRLRTRRKIYAVGRAQLARRYYNGDDGKNDASDKAAA